MVNSADKNTCTRALWVISKQSFPQDVVAKKVRIGLMFERSNLRATAVVVVLKGVAVPVCLSVLLHPRSGVDCAGHAGECVASRGHPVSRHGTRGPECCHQVKEGSALVHTHRSSSGLFAYMQCFERHHSKKWCCKPLCDDSKGPMWGF